MPQNPKNRFFFRREREREREMNGSPQHKDNWHADPKNTKQIVDLLVSTMDPRTRNDVRRQALRQLNGLKTRPGFLRYLSFIFNCSTNNVSLQIRCVAGLYLKTGLRKCQITNDLIAIRADALSRVSDPIKPIRNTASSIINCVVKRCKLKSWPQLLPRIVPMLASRNANECFGAFNILSKLCEDIPDQLDSDDVGRPLNTIVPMLIRIVQNHSSHMVRSLALDCINHLIPNMPAAMDVNFQHLLGAISKVSSDKSPEVRRRVCESINLLMEVRLELLMSGMPQIMQFMWRATNDTETEVRLHATSFWSSCCMCGPPVHNLMRNLLPRLLPTLLDGMRFADDDEMLEGYEDTDAKPDRPEDIEPHLFGKQGKGGLNDDDEDGNSTWTDDQVEGKWTVRKASGLALDNIASVYGNQLLGLVLPELEKRLNHTDWRTRESAILAIGAVSEGGMNQFVPKLFPFLMNLLKDNMVLIRSITCWTLGRYTGWMMEHKKYFEAFLGAILHLIVDRNKRVQEAAVSAFAVIVENAESMLIPYLDQIVRSIGTALERYQDKNLHVLYDAIIMMIETLGQDGIRNENHIASIIRPMVSKLQLVKNDNRMILPLVECFTSLCKEFGLYTPMQSLARTLYHRALKIIEFGLLAGTSAAEKGEDEFLESEHIYVALDLVSGLADGIEKNMQVIVQNTNLLDLLGHCAKVKNFYVRQSVSAVIGDLSRTAPAYVAPASNALLNVLCEGLLTPYVPARNNSSWAVGELTVNVLSRGAADKVSNKTYENVLDRMIAVMTNDDVDESVLRNCSVAIGRLSLVRPPLVAARLSKVARAWSVSMTEMEDDDEKRSSFVGMIRAIRLNPRAFLGENLFFLCVALANWGTEEAIPNDLALQFKTLLQEFRNMLISSGTWPKFYENLPNGLRETLGSQYGFGR